MASRRFFLILTARKHPSNDRQRTQSSPRQREKELGLIREIYCLREVFFFPPEVKGTILPSPLFPVDTQWSHQECHTCTQRWLRAREIHQDYRNSREQHSSATDLSKLSAAEGEHIVQVSRQLSREWIQSSDSFYSSNRGSVLKARVIQENGRGRTAEDQKKGQTAEKGDLYAV